ncbi:MAG: GbsR/MarR family transcriptional regulator [Actinomycetes bacterium]
MIVQGSTRGAEAAQQFVERFAATLVEAGMPRMPSRVFAAILVSGSGRMTSAELSEALHVSPAAVSGAVRYLAPLGLLSRERERGTRRDVYVVHDDQWHEAVLRSDRTLLRWEQVLREGVEGLGDQTPAGARVAHSLAFVEFMQEEVRGMSERWRQRRAELEQGR